MTSPRGRPAGLRDPVVCIVGAGPAGLVTAHLLRRAGISFVVLERQDADGLRAHVKAGMIEHRTVELLRPSGLADPIVGGGRRIGMCEFRADGQAFVLDYASLCGGRVTTSTRSTSSSQTGPGSSWPRAAT